MDTFNNTEVSIHEYGTYFIQLSSLIWHHNDIPVQFYLTPAKFFSPNFCYSFPLTSFYIYAELIMVPWIHHTFYAFRLLWFPLCGIIYILHLHVISNVPQSQTDWVGVQLKLLMQCLLIVSLNKSWFLCWLYLLHSTDCEYLMNSEFLF